MEAVVNVINRWGLLGFQVLVYIYFNFKNNQDKDFGFFSCVSDLKKKDMQNCVSNMCSSRVEVCQCSTRVRHQHFIQIEKWSCLLEAPFEFFLN